MKFLSEKFFARKNAVNSPSALLAIDADKTWSSSVNGILHNLLHEVLCNNNKVLYNEAGKFIFFYFIQKIYRNL